MQVFVAIRISVLLSVTLTSMLVSKAFADTSATAATSTVIIDYHVKPENRVALKNYMRRTGLARFEAMRRHGAIADYHILFNRYVDSDNWDMMAIISFSTNAQLSSWRGTEETAPAGLSVIALRIISSIHSAPADLVRSEEGSPGSGARKPVYLVIPYSFRPSETEYAKYFDTYVAPEIDGWIKAGIVDRYALYTARYGAARPWRSMIIYQYHGDEGLSRRSEAIAAVRAELQRNPQWKAASESKQSIREELQAVVADELSGR
ncbi:hypothetical protein [Paraburkholderia humisilvae]|uniref:NIPSNAP domain-containing protein n=1 Tax=Paraburkholderia humisilvae TaxID=627669 RepID=A0A6J5D9J0_9BURK|nr:hypothetical protein [Paraburkholderia humisilvae]CAB3750980.1 hypothetical protein LMG29542_01383 [Paraburkholderia humisilvae]